MQIQKLSTRCNINEANGVVNDLSRAYDSVPALASDTNLSSIMTTVRAQGAELNHAIELQGAVSELDEKDLIRDEAARAIYYAIAGYKYNPSPALQAAAVQVGTVFDLFGLAMLKDSFVVESSKISALLAKFAEPSVAAQIKLLPGMETLVSTLATAATTFETARVAYESEMAQEKTIASASDLKKILVTTINTKLVTYVRGMVSVDESRYGTFAGQINQFIGIINEAVDRRATLREKKA